MPNPLTALAALLILMAPRSSLLAGDLQKPVRIESGLIEGSANGTRDVVAFKGIPYAAPPVGDLRWREPQPAAKWDGVRKADRFGASCPQPFSTGAPPYTEEFAVRGAMSEDCLFLNVWAPAKPAKDKVAVMVYLHGGSGTRGSGSIPVYDGESLARKGIIVVTVNFRLGILGGMGHPQLSQESPHKVCGNYGMLDMIAALKWVRANITAFGGDPEKVTLCGQSSGAHAVHSLTTSPLAKGLFRGVISVSFPYDYLTKQHAIGNVWQKEQQGLKFAAAKKAGSIKELRKIPAADLIADDPAVEPFTRAALGGGVNTDGWAFPADYPKALDQGLVADVPTLTGITADDFGPPAGMLKATFATFATDLQSMFGENKGEFAGIKDAYLELCPVATDAEGRAMAKRAQQEYRMASIHAWAAGRAKTAKVPAYTYLFDHAIPWPEHPEFGAFHSSDLVYWFGNLSKLKRPWTATDRRVADQVSDCWVNFVKTGNPNGDGLPEWHAFAASRPATMTLGAQPGMRDIADEPRLELYLHLLAR